MVNTGAMLGADGWQAVYVTEDDSPSKEWDNETDRLFAIPLVCFAFLEDMDTGEGQIVGMVPEGAGIVPCTMPNFLGYLPRGAVVTTLLPLFREWKDAQAEEAERQALLAEVRTEQLKSSSEKPETLPPIDRWN